MGQHCTVIAAASHIHALRIDDRFEFTFANLYVSAGSRDLMVTYYDLDDAEAACGVCRICRVAQGHVLLQIRRSTYHEVVQVGNRWMHLWALPAMNGNSLWDRLCCCSVCNHAVSDICYKLQINL